MKNTIMAIHHTLIHSGKFEEATKILSLLKRGTIELHLTDIDHALEILLEKHLKPSYASNGNYVRFRLSNPIENPYNETITNS